MPHLDSDLSPRSSLASLGGALSLAIDEVIGDLQMRDLQSRCVLEDAVEALILAIARTSDVIP